MIDRTPQKNLKITCPSCEQKLDASGIDAFAQIACPTCGVSITVPCRFGQYLLEEPLGENDVTGVYRALDLKLDREVCVKVLDRRAAEKEDLVECFLAVGRRAAGFNHVNILPIFASDSYQGLPFLAMEYMAGQSLGKLLKSHADRQLPLDTCLYYAEQVARALASAQREGVVHGNIKPENILLGTEGTAKVSDFGMMNVHQTYHGETGDPPQKCLPPAYTSPERFQSDTANDCRTDIFSLGAVLYHLTTGRQPFPGTRAERQKELNTGPKLAPTALRPSMPAPLNDLIMRTLSPEQDDRPAGYQKMISLFSELRNEVSENNARQYSGTSGQKRGKGRVFKKSGNGRQRGSRPPGSPLSMRGQQVRRQRRLRRTFQVLTILGLAALVAVLLLASRHKTPWYTENVQPILNHIQETFRSTPRNGPASDNTTPSDSSTGEQENGPGSSGQGHGQPVSGGNAAPPPPNRLPVNIGSRPRPRGLDFEARKDDLRQYLRRQPPQLRRIENDRISYLNACRSHLIRMMSKFPITETHTIALHSGRTLRGTVPLANENHIAVRVKSPRRRLVRVSWDELPFTEYVDFFDYYAQRRLDYQGTDTRVTAKKHAAKEYFRLALLCDWYGYQSRARNYKEKAETLDPELKPLLSRLLYYLE